MFSFLLFAEQTFGAVCPKGSHFVHAHHRRGYVRYDGVVFSPTTVRSHCARNSKAYEKWEQNFENKLPLNWPHKEKSVSWTDADISRVVNAIENLPEFLWKYSKKKLYRAQESVDGSNPATSGGNYIVLYNSAFSGRYNLSRVLAHEFAHDLYSRNENGLTQDYRLVSGWGEYRHAKSEVRIIQRSEGYVEKDGRTSSDEDFANNIEYFFYEPQKLIKLTPEVYNWIKGVYLPSLEGKK